MSDFKLKWQIEKTPDGKFKRRVDASDAFGQEHIDVVWTHADGFPAETTRQPKSYDFVAKVTTFVDVVGEKRDKVHDQVSVPPGTTDETVAMHLDGKRARLAANLGVQP